MVSKLKDSLAFLQLGKAHICRIPPAVPVVWLHKVGRHLLLDLCDNHLSPQVLVGEKVGRK